MGAFSEDLRPATTTIWALDPGPVRSALVGVSTESWLPEGPVLAENARVLAEVEGLRWGLLVIEMVASYGMPVGRTVFETAFWAGRFAQASPIPTVLVYRKQVVMALCGSARARDSNVIRRLKDLYADHPEASAHGAEPAVGVKSDPGPLYGLRRDLWQAFAIAYVTAQAYTGEGDHLPVIPVKSVTTMEL